MSLFEFASLYSLYYPSIMAIIWVIGGLYYYFTRERQSRSKAEWVNLSNTPPNTSVMVSRYNERSQKDEWVQLMAYQPMVTIMVPCYNEGENIEEVARFLLEIYYPNFEILLINDGSKDDTGERIDRLAQMDPRIRALHQKNQGKATGLNNGLKHAKGEILICIDGDAVLDHDAILWMVRHFENNPTLGAVTGNPRVRTRSTVVGQLQVAEFSAIIGLIKRTQSLYGTIFTVSGVIVAFSKKAIEHIGGWSPDMITEDIDVTWKLQMSGYEIVYEPHALCWVLMPETIKGLFKQRLRWAQGGAEVFLKYGLESLLSWKKRRFWPLVLEYIASLTWCYALLALTAYGLLFFNMSDGSDPMVLKQSSVMVLAICLAQFVVSLFIDSHYDRAIWKSFMWCIWYPMAYWLLNFITMCIAFPKVLVRKKGQLAVWESPDRGRGSGEKK